MRTFTYLFILLIAAAGCGANQCRSVGKICGTTADCCDNLVCSAGNTCEVLGACPTAAPIDCGTTLPGMCCPRSNPVCCARDGACHVSAADCNAPSCADKNKSCRTSATCCTGLTCARFGHFCQEAKSLILGDACTASAQCKSKVCSDYCTKSCTSSDDCDSGAVTSCLETASGFLCIPFCSTNADCTVFGPSVSCQSGRDPGGLTFNGCFAK